MHRTCSLCICFARLYGPWLVFGSFLSSLFPVIVFKDVGWSERNGMPPGAVPLCVMGNPCWCLDRKCVLCPTKNAKGNFDRMECYTNSNLAKMVEIIQTPVRDWCLFYALSTNRYLKREECLLSLWWFLWHHRQTDIGAIRVQIPVVGFRHSQNMGPAPRKSLGEQMCIQEQDKVAYNEMETESQSLKACGFRSSRGGSPYGLGYSALQFDFLKVDPFPKADFVFKSP